MIVINASVFVAPLDSLNFLRNLAVQYQANEKIGYSSVVSFRFDPAPIVDDSGRGQPKRAGIACSETADRTVGDLGLTDLALFTRSPIYASPESIGSAHRLPGPPDGHGALPQRLDSSATSATGAMMEFFRKQRYLIDFTLSSLLRRKGKNFGLLLVYALIVFMLASVMLFTHALRQEAGIILQNSPEIILQRLVAGRHALMPADYLQKIGRVRGVTKKQGRLWGYFYDPAVKANYTMMVDEQKALTTTEVIIGAGIARTRGIGIGDYITFRSHDGKAFSFQVKEILDPDSELISADLVLMSEKAYRVTFGVPRGYFTDLVLKVRNPREVRNIAEKLSLKLPDARPILREEILRTYDSIFSWRQGIVFVLLAGAVLAFAIFAWDKASGLSAEEKREIGILKAVGWETADVLRMKFWEGAIISLTRLYPWLSGSLCPCLSMVRPVSSSRCSRAGRCSIPSSGPFLLSTDCRWLRCSFLPSFPTSWPPSFPSGGPRSPTRMR